MSAAGWDNALADPTRYASEWNLSGQEKIRELKGRTDLTENAKAERIAKIKADTNTKIEALRDAATQAEANKLDGLRKKMFRPPTPWNATDTEKVTIATSHRDALDRASRTEFLNAELTSMLKRSVLTDDRVQAKAVLAVALERNDVNAINAYMGAYPDESDEINRYYSATHAPAGQGFSDFLRFAPI